MEAIFNIDALKGCASTEDTCAKFKADIQASIDKESSESTNTVSLDKCKNFSIKLYLNCSPTYLLNVCCCFIIMFLR